LPLALDHVSFKLPHAAKVGVVGRTGSGKSTLLVALFRLIQPSGGDLIVSGCNINNVNVHKMRRQLSIIPQVVSSSFSLCIPHHHVCFASASRMRSLI
jgi:ABC-type multidrug transport system fused ATPase/permease subunit